MLRIDVVTKSATAALCSGTLLGFFFAVGCSEQPPKNRLDDPKLKPYMNKRMEDFKAKTKDAQINNLKTGRSTKGFRRP
jgi:hypothetical protein